MKDYIKYLKLCVKRLYHAEDMLNRYLEGSISKLDCLNLEGDTEDYRHPVLDLEEEEGKLFLMMTGEPLQFPKDFTKVSPQDFRKKIVERRDKLREIAGMKKSHRWIT